MIRSVLMALSLVVPAAASECPPAAASELPPVLPTRDVAVTYRVIGDTTRLGTVLPISSLRVAFSARDGRLRVDPVGQPAYLLADRTAGRVMLVMTEQHSVIELPYDINRALRIDDKDGHITRRGSASVAGLGCTNYDVQTAQGHGSACLTDDGVLLRVQGETGDKRAAGLEATAVSYAPQPIAQFDPPHGFMRLAMPVPRLSGPAGASKN